MKKLVEAFPKQLDEALKIGIGYKFKSTSKKFQNVVITGLGGSGIGGSIVQNFCFNLISVPLVVNKDYFLPAFVNEKTLVIVCSYSGNTEETLEAMDAALNAGATIVCITSGGKIGEIAKDNKLDCILVPSGMPPRSCLGYSMVQILFALAHFKLIGLEFVAQIQASIKLLDEGQKDIIKSAKSLSKKISGKLPIIYSSPAYEGVAIRFRQQINENSKLLCWHAVIPEMNHNELVGWRDNAEDKAVIIFRNSDDYARVNARIDINKAVFKKYTKNIFEIESKGDSYFERAFYLIHLTDWVSVILAEIRELDATEVKVIDFLKGSLAKI